MKLKYSPEIMEILGLMYTKHQEHANLGRVLNTYSNTVTNAIEKQFDIREGQMWKNKKTGHTYLITGIMTAHLPVMSGRKIVGPITEISYRKDGFIRHTTQRLETFLDDFVKVV